MNVSHISRRKFLQASLVSGAAMMFPSILNAASTNIFGARKSAQSVILLWLDGAPSQIDTFDPKPGRENGGQFRAIDTSIHGVQFSEHLPRLAKLASQMSIIRTVNSKEAAHDRGAYLLHTGYAPQAGLIHPSTGSLISYESLNKSDLPDYVNIGSLYSSNAIGRGPGFLSQKHSPFVITDSHNPSGALSVLNEDTTKRTALFRSLDEQFMSEHISGNINLRDLFYQQSQIIKGSKFEESLSLSSEPEELVKSYIGKNTGQDTSFGFGCLAARRLVQNGVKFVEVGLGGWDTHQDNFTKTKALCDILDPAFSTLIDDLKRNSLFESTLVVCMGEFGRTPKINAAQGRDHWSKNFSVALAGGPLARGRVFGATDIDGMEITKDPVSVPDLMATIYSAVGIDPSLKFKREDTRLVKYTNDGVPIKDLFL